MGLRDLKDRVTGTSLTGEEALRGDSLHLGQLRRLFDPLRLADGKTFDRPLVILAFTNRSGSTYLGQLLASAPDLYGFREDLNHSTVARRTHAERLGDFTAYLDHVVGLNAAPGAGFGLKASAEQLRLIRLTGIDRAFGRVRVVRIRRRDRIAQAVSLWMAWKTRQWTSRQVARDVALHYDHHALRRALQNVQEAESALDLALSVLPYPVLQVEYETLCRVPGRTIAALREGLELPPCEIEDKSWTLRQVSDQKSEFVSRFRAELAARWEIES